MLGISIGVLLLVKITIVRYFSHFSSALPYLGTTIMLCTFLLIGLSVSFTLREHFLRSGTHVAGGNVFSDENLQRVHSLLQTAGLSGEVPLGEIASKEVLREGRGVLLPKCVFCHDLRTILAKPRTPSSWVQTVHRMAIKPMLGPPLTERDQWTSSAHLIAITPDLQNSAKKKRQQKLERSRTELAMRTAAITTSTDLPDSKYDQVEAERLFNKTCSQCHDISEVDAMPPASSEEARELVLRMLDNGLDLTEDQIETIARYLKETYVQNTRETLPTMQ